MVHLERTVPWWWRGKTKIIPDDDDSDNDNDHDFSFSSISRGISYQGGSTENDVMPRGVELFPLRDGHSLYQIRNKFEFKSSVRVYECVCVCFSSQTKEIMIIK